MIQRVPSLVGQQGEECELGPAVSFTKGMDSIEFTQEMCSLICELLRIEVSQVIGFPQLIEQLGRLTFNILRKAKRIVALRYPDGSRLACPVVDILERW